MGEQDIGKQTPTNVVAYLRALDIAGRDLPQSVRLDLRARTVRTLVATAGDQPGETEVNTALAALGEPTELVATERRRYNLEPDPLLSRDIAAVYLMASGPFLLGLGVVGGLTLLWVSSRWPLRQRTIATVVFVVGAAVSLALPLMIPALHLLTAFLIGIFLVGPWSAAAYLAALRCDRRMRVARHVRRQGVG